VATRVRALWCTSGLATHDEQVRLNLRYDECVARSARLRLEDGRAIAYELTSIPLSRVQKPQNSCALSDLKELAAINGLVLGRATERMTRVPADPIVARHLGLPVCQRVMRLDRTVETDAGLPIEWRLSFVVEEHPRAVR